MNQADMTKDSELKKDHEDKQKWQNIVGGHRSTLQEESLQPQQDKNQWKEELKGSPFHKAFPYKGEDVVDTVLS